MLEEIKNAGFVGKLSGGKEFITTCPYCNKREKFSINIRNGLYQCFSGSCRQTGHISKFIGSRNINSDEFFSKQDLFTTEIEEEEYIADENELNQYKKIHQYILDRGFDKYFLMANKIGYDQEKHRITIPIYMDDIYYGCIKRSVIDAQPKYTYPKSMPKNATIYMPPILSHKSPVRDLKWSLNNRNVLLVVEGSLDALKATQHGYRACSVLGCEISEAQMELIEKYAAINNLDIVLLFDNDDAGKLATSKMLGQYFWIEFKVASLQVLDRMPDVCYNVVKKDVGELTKEELDFVIDNTQTRYQFTINELLELSNY